MGFLDVGFDESAVERLIPSRVARDGMVEFCGFVIAAKWIAWQ
jgi:hypothetical protein